MNKNKQLPRTSSEVDVNDLLAKNFPHGVPPTLEVREVTGHGFVGVAIYLDYVSLLKEIRVTARVGKELLVQVDLVELKISRTTGVVPADLLQYVNPIFLVMSHLACKIRQTGLTHGQVRVSSFP